MSIDRKISVIEGEHYQKTREKLKKDPIIQSMVKEIPLEYLNETHLQSWNFIRGALDEYRNRGGKVKTHIGGPAEAIRELIKEEN